MRGLSLLWKHLNDDGKLECCVTALDDRLTEFGKQKSAADANYASAQRDVAAREAALQRKIREQQDLLSRQFIVQEQVAHAQQAVDLLNGYQSLEAAFRQNGQSRLVTDAKLQQVEAHLSVMRAFQTIMPDSTNSGTEIKAFDEAVVTAKKGMLAAKAEVDRIEVLMRQIQSVKSNNKLLELSVNCPPDEKTNDEFFLSKLTVFILRAAGLMPANNAVQAHPANAAAAGAGVLAAADAKDAKTIAAPVAGVAAPAMVNAGAAAAGAGSNKLIIKN